jgi:hypothetical protein
VNNTDGEQDLPDQAYADYPVAPLQRTLAIALVVIAALGFAALTVVDPDWVRLVAALVGAAAGAAAYVGLIKLLARRRTALYASLPVAVPTDGDPERRAVRRGLALAAVYLVAEVVVLGGWTLAGGDSAKDTAALVLVVVFAGGIASFAQVRDLRRWEAEHGLRVCNRVGAPRFAWTRRVVREQLVVVPTD